MATVVHRNIVNKDLGPPVFLDRRRRKLSSVLAKQVRTKVSSNRPFIVSVHKPGECLRPTDASVRLRATWKLTYIEPDDTILIMHLPLGGDSGKMIGLTVA